VKGLAGAVGSAPAPGAGCVGCETKGLTGGAETPPAPPPAGCETNGLPPPPPLGPTTSPPPVPPSAWVSEEEARIEV
jgi:hypothetical protein